MPARGYHQSEEAKLRISGINNQNWKEYGVSYKGLHQWVRRHIIMPDRCPKCGSTKRLDVCNISGKYLRDIDDYECMCRKCHITRDGRVEKNLRRGNQFIDMSGRICSECKTDKTYIKKNGRPDWNYHDGKLVCARCKRRHYGWKKKRSN